MNNERKWNTQCEFYSWECEYPYFLEYCTHYNTFVQKRKTCKNCKGFKGRNEIENE